jgi:glycosyltransferase involved in cell wall biosynthesis
VTPFYNTADFLPECIESVLAQTHANFEYILLNNASTDGSAELAERYARRDERIRLISNARLLPQVENYNHALQFVSPESAYCKIVQADDWIYPQCVEAMVAVAVRAPSVSIVSAYSCLGREVVLDGLDQSETVVNGREICRRYFLEKLWVFGSPTSLLYRSDLVRGRDPFYRLDRPNEDTDLCFELLLDSDLGFVHQVLSYLRPRSASMSTVTAELRTWELAELLYVERYAQQCMSDNEWHALHDLAWARYYEQLGGRLLRVLSEPLPRGFWLFHKRGLESIGHALKKTTIARGMASATLKLLLPSIMTRPAWRPRHGNG